MQRRFTSKNTNKGKKLYTCRVAYPDQSQYNVEFVGFALAKTAHHARQIFINQVNLGPHELVVDEDVESHIDAGLVGKPSDEDIVKGIETYGHAKYGPIARRIVADSSGCIDEYKPQENVDDDDDDKTVEGQLYVANFWRGGVGGDQYVYAVSARSRFEALQMISQNMKVNGCKVDTSLVNVDASMKVYDYGAVSGVFYFDSV